MTTNPWTVGVLSRNFVELIGVTINAFCTNLNPEGTRVHIRAALHEGVTRDEILMVLKMASILPINSCALGGPIVLEEGSEACLDAAGVRRAKRLKKAGERTTAIDKMKALKQWNDSWDPLVALAPVWADQFMATDVAIYTSGVFSTILSLRLLILAIQKQIWLDSRGVFHGDVRCVTKRQPASELAVAIREVFEGHIFLSRRE